MLIDKRSRAAVEASEGYADGQVTETDLGAFQAESDAALEAIRRGKRANSPEARTASIAWIAAENYPGGIWNAPYEILGVQGINVGAEKKAQCAILRDICNPFHPVVLAKSWLAWNGGMVRKIAQAIYDERAFERMPILADVLEDAGCDDADLLAHCRGPGPHARGCWVVDLLLGKE